MLDVGDISDLLGAEMIGVVLEDEAIIVSHNHGEPGMGKHSVSEECYMNIARRLSGEELPIPDYIRRKSIFSRIFFHKNTAGKLV